MNVLITGGASGLGEVIVSHLANKMPDHRIYFTYCKSRTKAEQLCQKYTNVTAHHCDFSNDESVDALADAMAHLEPDVLINNSYVGKFMDKHFHKTSSATMASAFHDNVLSVARLTSSCIRVFRQKGQGRIITISTAALTGKPPAGTSVYLMVKSCLESLHRNWVNENAAYAISSNIIRPAMMETGLTADLDERIKDLVREQHPLHELLPLEDVAKTVFFLIHTSKHLNGETITLNAGSSNG